MKEGVFVQYPSAVAYLATRPRQGARGGVKSRGELVLVGGDAEGGTCDVQPLFLAKVWRGITPSSHSSSHPTCSIPLHQCPPLSPHTCVQEGGGRPPQAHLLHRCQPAQPPLLSTPSPRFFARGWRRTVASPLCAWPSTSSIPLSLTSSPLPTLHPDTVRPLLAQHQGGGGPPQAHLLHRLQPSGSCSRQHLRLCWRQQGE